MKENCKACGIWKGAEDLDVLVAWQKHCKGHSVAPGMPRNISRNVSYETKLLSKYFAHHHGIPSPSWAKRAVHNLYGFSRTAPACRGRFQRLLPRTALGRDRDREHPHTKGPSTTHHTAQRPSTTHNTAQRPRTSEQASSSRCVCARVFRR